jgi:hypothetical protein
MSQTDDTNRAHRGAAPEQPAKKPYHKPEVRYEKVFETRALLCGKVQTTQGNCAHRRQNS